MLGKLAELFLFGLAPFAFAGLLMPAATAAEEVAIAGEASPRERVALPPGALRMVSQDAGAAPAALFDTVWLAEDIGG
ncbi:MAG TPA: hypothetical protein VIZ90_17565, partial [Rhizobiaceae bacterium]